MNDKYKIVCDQDTADLIIKVIRKYSYKENIHYNLDECIIDEDYIGLCFTEGTFGFFAKNSMADQLSENLNLLEFINFILNFQKKYKHL